MTAEAGGYPQPSVTVQAFSAIVDHFKQRPAGVSQAWPPTQWKYIVDHLTRLGCQTVIAESHYIDRDFVDDMALFYARSLRGYRNSCERLHFFSKKFDDAQWRSIVAASPSDAAIELKESYLGFLVRKPLPGIPVGRTVLVAGGDGKLALGGTRKYVVHLAGIDFKVPSALAFQQQDQGVSACATTALWSAMHKTAYVEGIRIPTPAAITQSASRYYLPGGRALPSEGLTISQMSEACRAVDLSPLLVQATDLEAARGVIHTVLESGFPAVLSIAPGGASEGHAVCVVAYDRREIQAQADSEIRALDAGSAVDYLRIHDDRLGPYAEATFVGGPSRQGTPPRAEYQESRRHRL